MKQSIWLGIFAGFLCLLGVKTLLPNLGVAVIRAISLLTSNQSIWMERLDDTTKAGWYVIQGFVFLGAIAAGTVATLVSRDSKYLLPATLVALCLLATFFEQFPRPANTLVVFVWVGAPVIGVLMGTAVIGRWWRLSGA